MTIRYRFLALALSAPLVLAAAPSPAESEGLLGFGEELRDRRGEIERPLGRTDGYVPPNVERLREGAEERMEEREEGFLHRRSGEIGEAEIEDD
jgi:hypothetical protein